MATLKQRLHRKNASGTYDVVHLETSADLVLMTDGKTKLSDKLSTMDTTIAGKLASTGTAAKATKLATARTVRTNLASTATASFDGSANITPGVTGILPVANGGTGVTSLDGLKGLLGVGGSGPTGISYDFSNITVGKICWFNYDKWRCVHNDGTTYYLIKETIDENVKFGSDTVYLGSTLAARCLSYQNDMATDSLAKCKNWTVNGVTQKVNIMSYEQANGGFSWFNSNERRLAYMRGSLANYWTSSPLSNSVRFVNTTGGIIMYNNFGASATCGFRPCVAVAV